MSKRRPKALLLNPDWKYEDSTVTAQPGYLARKFAALIKAQKRPVAAGNVTALKKKG